MIKCNRAVFVMDGYKALFEPSFRYGSCCTFLTFDSELFGCFAADALNRCNGVGAHTLIGLRMQFPKLRIVLVHEGQTRRICQ